LTNAEVIKSLGRTNPTKTVSGGMDLMGSMEREKDGQPKNARKKPRERKVAFRIGGSRPSRAEWLSYRPGDAHRKTVKRLAIPFGFHGKFQLIPERKMPLPGGRAIFSVSLTVNPVSGAICLGPGCPRTLRQVFILLPDRGSPCFMDLKAGAGQILEEGLSRTFKSPWKRI
jgi:hypothetical protein